MTEDRQRSTSAKPSMLSPSPSPSLTNLLNPVVDGDDNKDGSATAAKHNPDDYFSQTNDDGARSPSPQKRPHKRQRDDDEPPAAPAPAPAVAVPTPTPTTTSTSRARQSSRIEPSIFNIEPLNEYTREVADWLWTFASSHPHWDEVEIEAKIGVLLDTSQQHHDPKRPPHRFHLPIVPCETIITDDSFLRFESNMTLKQHQGFNQILNSLVERSAEPSYPFATVRYAHTREVDGFIVLPGENGGKVRVTTGQDGKKRALKKTRLANMNVYSPKRTFDFRISVSTETQLPVPKEPVPGPFRQKDRITYTHQLFQIDLTQVFVTRDSRPAHGDLMQHLQGGNQVTHELEIEIRDVKALLVEGQKEKDGLDNKYLELVQALLNNIHMLIRNAPDP